MCDPWVSTISANSLNDSIECDEKNAATVSIRKSVRESAWIGALAIWSDDAFVIRSHIQIRTLLDPITISFSYVNTIFF